MEALISSMLAIPPSLALFTDVMMMYFVPYSKLLMCRLNSVNCSTYPSMTFMDISQLRLQNYDLCFLNVDTKSNSVSFSFTL